MDTEKINLNLSDEDMQIIVEGLNELKAGRAYKTIRKIEEYYAQLNALKAPQLAEVPHPPGETA